MKFLFYTICLVLLSILGLAENSISTAWERAEFFLTGKRFSVEDRLSAYGPKYRPLLKQECEQAGVSYPPKKILLLGLKKEKKLQVYAENSQGEMKLLHSYPVLAASGGMGPKTREGDNQVPEGFYKIELLNPNSQFHLSLRVSYPNAFDRERAKEEKRARLGGDIMIHGSFVSIGCIAIGDPGIEKLFVLAADTGLSKIDVLISPVDFREREVQAEDLKMLPRWVPGLYAKIRETIVKLPKA